MDKQDIEKLPLPQELISELIEKHSEFLNDNEIESLEYYLREFNYTPGRYVYQTRDVTKNGKLGKLYNKTDIYELVEYALEMEDGELTVDEVYRRFMDYFDVWKDEKISLMEELLDIEERLERDEISSSEADSLTDDINVSIDELDEEIEGLFSDLLDRYNDSILKPCKIMNDYNTKYAEKCAIYFPCLEDYLRRFIKVITKYHNLHIQPNYGDYRLYNAELFLQSSKDKKHAFETLIQEFKELNNHLENYAEVPVAFKPSLTNIAGKILNLFPIDYEENLLKKVINNQELDVFDKSIPDNLFCQHIQDAKQKCDTLQNKNNICNEIEDLYLQKCKVKTDKGWDIIL